MLSHRTILPATLFLLLCIAAQLSSAQPDPDEHGSRRPPPPPQEAIEACEGKQENAVCSFTGRRNDVVEGICVSPPRLESLVCAPEGGRQGLPPRSGGMN